MDPLISRSVLAPCYYVLCHFALAWLSANKRYHLSQGWSRVGISQRDPLRALPAVAARGGGYLAEIEGLLLLEVGAWPLLTVGDGS